MNNTTIIICLIAVMSQAFAQTADSRRKEFNLEGSGLAIQGYDPVAYFTTGKAIEGKDDVTIMHEGVKYRFSSQHHKELFKADPAKYEPQYGGWCAYAMGASGDKVEIDPETFKIVDGKLYLFYNKYFNNTLKSWNKDESRLNTSADQNWQKILQKKK